jgi:LysR family transcriptional regulator, hypochlorite-specific transcription factor HypT
MTGHSFELYYELIQDLLAIDEAGNIKEAAELMGTSQPVLSRRLNRLEEHLGNVQLFIRGNARQPTALTDAGKALVQLASKFGRDLNHLTRQYRKIPKTSLEITLAAPHALAIYFVPFFIPVLTKSALPQKFHLTTYAANIEDCLTMFESGLANFLLSWHSRGVLPLLPDRRFESIRIASDKLIPVCHVEDADKFAKCFLEKRPSSVPLLDYAPGTTLGGPVHTIIEQANLQNCIIYTHTSDAAGALKQMIRNRLGMAWIPMHAIAGSKAIVRLDIMIKDMAKSSRIEKDWRGDLTMPLEIHLIRSRRSSKISEAANVFWGAVENFAEKNPDFGDRTF